MNVFLNQMSNERFKTMFYFSTVAYYGLILIIFMLRIAMTFMTNCYAVCTYSLLWILSPACYAFIICLTMIIISEMVVSTPRTKIIHTINTSYITTTKICLASYLIFIWMWRLQILAINSVMHDWILIIETQRITIFLIIYACWRTIHKVFSVLPLVVVVKA